MLNGILGSGLRFTHPKQLSYLGWLSKRNFILWTGLRLLLALWITSVASVVESQNLINTCFSSVPIPGEYFKGCLSWLITQWWWILWRIEPENLMKHGNLRALYFNCVSLPSAAQCIAFSLGAMKFVIKVLSVMSIDVTLELIGCSNSCGAMLKLGRIDIQIG